MVCAYQNIEKGNLGRELMRRRQVYAQADSSKEASMREVPNSNIISNTAQPELKRKAGMFLPYQSDILKPDGAKAKSRTRKTRKK